MRCQINYCNTLNYGITDQQMQRLQGVLGKVDDSKSGGASSNLAMAIWEKSACAVGQGTLPKVVLDNDHLLSLDYEHGMLKDDYRLKVRIHNIHEIKVYKIYQTLIYKIHINIYHVFLED